MGVTAYMLVDDGRSRTPFAASGSRRACKECGDMRKEHGGHDFNIGQKDVMIKKFHLEEGSRRNQEKS